MTMIQLRQTVTYSLSIQAMIKGKWKIQRTNSLEDDLVGGLIADLANPDILSPEDTLTVYLDTLQKLDLKEMTSYLGVVNIMNTSDTAKIPLPQHLPNRFIKILIMSLNPAVKMDTMPLLQLKLQPLTVIRSWLIIRKSLINIWLLLTQLSMAPRNDTRNLSKFF